MPVSRSGGGFGPPAAAPAAQPEVFPLEVSSNGRYLQQADGDPFFIIFDTAWSICNQLTTAEIDTYLDDCVEKGFTAIVMEFNERYATDWTPAHLNAYGNAPFGTMSPVDWTDPVDAFWDVCDHVVDGCKARGMLVIGLPAYSGYPSTDEGWSVQYMAASDADLLEYGEFLGTRYQQGNILWVGAGDKSITGSEQTKQLHIFEGIRNIQPNALMSGHSTTNSTTRDFWDADYTDVDLIYYWEANGYFMYQGCKTSWDRSPAKPVFAFEPQYEYSIDAQGCRRAAWQSVLSGSIGVCPYGNWPIWHFSADDIAPNEPWEDHLDDPGRTAMQYVKTLLTSYSWWLLEPKDDTSVISSSLSTNGDRICPALASDGSFGMIWVPSSQTVTLVKSAFSPSLIRVRLYNTTTGGFTTHTASTSNTGTLSVATGGERVIVVDAA